MMLLGLLLGTVGMDPITGQLRLTMGIEDLNPGFATPVVAAGLLLAADGMVCLVSPSLWVATYGWIVPTWRNASPSVIVAMLLRIVAALAIAAACYAALVYSGRAWDVGLVLAFGVVGTACKLVGWNRLLVAIGCFYSDALEQKLRQTWLITQGELGLLWEKPLTAALWSAVFAIIALMPLLTAGRVRQAWRNGPATA